jgi:hypothetical protein
MPLLFCIYSMGIVYSLKRNCVKWPPHDVVSELMANFHPVMDPPLRPKASHPFKTAFKSLKAELNLICHLLAIIGVHFIFHFNRIRVKEVCG